MRPLGSIQIRVLTCLVEHGSYNGGRQWVWNTHHGTVKILDALVKRGLVLKRGDTYTITGAGREAIRGIDP